MPLRFTALAASLLLTLSTAHAQALNDTGQTQCYDASNAAMPCDVSSTGDTAARPRQDGRFGRDAQAAAMPAQLTKIGAGSAGFDYTKVCMSGQAAGTGSCPADPPQGTGANEWACTRDNVTGLVWSLESLGGDWAAAISTLPATYNGATRCGYATGWRTPTRRDLLSLVDHGKATQPMIDTDHFPSTQPAGYWSSDPVVGLVDTAWFVSFGDGYTLVSSMATARYVRLVRSGQ